MSLATRSVATAAHSNVSKSGHGGGQTPNSNPFFGGLSTVKRTIVFAGLILAGALTVRAEEPVSRADFETLKAQIEKLSKESAAIKKENKALKEKFEPIESSVTKSLDAKYGPGAVVGTKNGKLTISGLVQVWYYSIQNDRRGLFDDRNVNNILDTNETQDNDSFRIRRAEVAFNFDVSENFGGVIRLDPAREAQSLPSFPTNQGNPKRTANSITSTAVANVQNGVGAAPRFLQDAYLTFKKVVPYHDFQIGQFKPQFGNESLVSASTLDFAERSFIGQIGDFRDVGAFVHGTFKDDRIQYWLSAHDGAGNIFQSGGQQQNRGDDNDQKDFIAKLLVRPVWKNFTWGSLELSAAAGWGIHGESGSSNPVDFPSNGLNRNQTDATRYTAYVGYNPGGPVEGLWLKGEWARYKDRHAPGSVIDILENDIDGNGTQDNPRPITLQGFYAGIGYKIGATPYAGKLPKWFRPFEFAVRYEQFDNVQVADRNQPNQTDIFRTQVVTAGVTYYLKGTQTKVQLNYNWVNEPGDRDSTGTRNFHEVRNDSLLVNFQVGF